MYYLIGNYTIEELLAISLESWIAQAIEEKKKKKEKNIVQSEAYDNIRVG